MIKPLALAAVLFYSSCSDLLENDNAFFHVSTQEQQWNSLTDTRSALFGIYGLMRTALGENNGFWAAGDLRLGDFTVRMRDDLQAIRDNRLDAPYDNIRQISNWNRFYKVVNAASVFIENAGKNSKCAGCWKVYCNECETMKLFEKFKKCTRIYTKLWRQGTSVEKLTVAA